MPYEFTNEIRMVCDTCGKAETVAEREFRGVIFAAEKRGWNFQWVGKRRKGQKLQAEVLNLAFCRHQCWLDHRERQRTEQRSMKGNGD